MSFNKGDIVQVVKGHWKAGGKVGVVSSVSDPGEYSYGYYCVTIEDNVHVISGKDLTPYDEKREALIALAETLDKARILANTMNETEGAVYGDISRALSDTLQILSKDEYDSTEVYDSLIDGSTVRDALKRVEK